MRGAQQLRERFPDAVIVMILPPSTDELISRMRRRGDTDEQIDARLALAAEEEGQGRELANHVVVNDDLDRATEELAGIVELHRSQEN